MPTVVVVVVVVVVLVGLLSQCRGSVQGVAPVARHRQQVTGASGLAVRLPVWMVVVVVVVMVVVVVVVPAYGAR